MLSLQTLHRHNATKAGHYYTDQKDDYYSQDGGAAQWQGEGARRLGLTGDVTPAAFVDAMRGNFGPEVTLSRSVRKDAKARAALDMTFSAPKSISIQALVHKDPTVLAAHDHAVAKALEHLENELIQARRKESGSSHLEATTNAVIAKFRHETARPTGFDDADPQLHTHALVMNLTQRTDGQWASVSNETIYRSRMMLDLVYKNEMATYLEKAGYTLRYEGDNIELAHISREQIEHFSKRGMTVEAELARMGKSRQSASRELKQAITLATRQAKRPEISREALQARWEREAKALGIEPKQAHLSAQMDQPGIAPPTPADLGQRQARAALDWAIRHLSEREAVMTEDTLLRTAMSHAVGTEVKPPMLKHALHEAVQRGHLVQGATMYTNTLDSNSESFSRQAWVQKMVREEGVSVQEARYNIRRAIATGSLCVDKVHYTTQVAREREKRILQIERDGQGKVAPIFSADHAQAVMHDKGLKPGQLRAANLALTSTNRIIGVQGLAGVGKSYMLQHVKSAMESADFTVKSVAPYSSQIKELRRLGVEAVTIASMLEAKQDRFTMDEKTVLVIDEAAVVPTRQMERILRKAEKVGARVMMMGDKDQTKAIEAGRPMHQLQDAGMQTALMGDILRQTNPVLKRAVELAAQGRAGESLHLLHTRLKCLREHRNDDERYAQIAHHYTSLPAAEQRETLIVTGTNSSRKAINELVHERLGLAGKGQKFQLLTRIDTTQAERRSTRYFQKDYVIQPERSYRVGLEHTSQYKVIKIDHDRNRLTVENLSTKERITFNPARATKLSVYKNEETELSVGDRVRVTRNDAKLDLVNGERYDVLSVTPTTVQIGQRDEAGNITQSIVLRGGKTSALHLDLAYVSTVHSAQGLSERGVIINQETFSKTTKSDVFYVAISRARENLTIYTNDITKLADAVSRREEKAAALDIGIAHRPAPLEPKHHSPRPTTPVELDQEPQAPRKESSHEAQL